MILRHIARPMPVPSNASRECSRWKMTKMRSAYWSSTPMPQSVTVNRQKRPSRSAAIVTRRDLDALGRGGRAPHAGELEQVVDQLLHPLGAVDGERDVAVGALVELALVAPLEHLGEARDLAQRLLQVVRGDVRELLELLVGALQLAGLLDQRALGVAQRRYLG